MPGVEVEGLELETVEGSFVLIVNPGPRQHELVLEHRVARELAIAIWMKLNGLDKGPPWPTSLDDKENARRLEAMIRFEEDDA